MPHYIQHKAEKFILTTFVFIAGVIFAENQPSIINLDGVKMNVVKTAENEVVNHETTFHFSHNDTFLSTEYQSGKILKGFLVGKLSLQNQLEFS